MSASAQGREFRLEDLEWGERSRRGNASILPRRRLQLPRSSQMQTLCVGSSLWTLQIWTVQKRASLVQSAAS